MMKYLTVASLCLFVTLFPPHRPARGADASSGDAVQTVALKGSLSAPPRIFRDENFTGTITVQNPSQTDCPGALYLRYTGRKPFVEILASRYEGLAGKTADYTFTIPYFNFEGCSGGVELFYRDLKEKDTVLARQNLTVVSQRRPAPGENVLVNSSFELPSEFCGSYLGYADILMKTAGWEGERAWKPLPIDGWYLDEGTTEQVTLTTPAHSGVKALQLDAVGGKTSVVSSLGMYVPAGTYMLSAYVKTKGAKGTLALDFLTGVRQGKEGGAQARASIDLPAGASEWTRISLKLDSPDMSMPSVHVVAEAGTVLLDDVQLEMGSTPTEYNVRPAEFLRLSFDGWDGTIMPKWLQDEDAPRILRVHNDSRLPLTGTVTVRTGPWNVPDLRELGTFDAQTLPPGEAKEFSFNTRGLRSDGYAATVELKDGGNVVHDGLWDFDPYAFTYYYMQNMLHSRAAGRYIVVPRRDPKTLFGIGNSTQKKHGAKNPLAYIEQHLHIRDVGMVCTRSAGSDDESFMIAVAGSTIFDQATFDYKPPINSPPLNPCDPTRVDVCTPEAVAYLKESGKKKGLELGANPLVMGIQLANEQYWAAAGAPCPTKAADNAFRTWCETRHGNLRVLNTRWKTNYTSWDEVDQVISERFYKNLVAKREGGASSMSWPMLSWGGGWPAEALAEMDRLPGKTMDWLRWRTDIGVKAYKIYADAAKAEDPRTLYSTDLPILNFYKQFFIPFVRAMDAAMINVRYTSGFQNSFGVPHECMASLEIAESVAVEQNKPFWGIEVYHTPYWPAESAALQNWGLIAHGVNVVLVFSWHPMSDRGDPTNILEWENRRNKKSDDPFDRACWYMIDVDGAYLPAYDVYVRSLKEIQRYHENFNGPSIKRAKTDVAIYVSNDTAESALLKTKGSPWGYIPERVSYTMIYLLRFSGITADVVDDTSLPCTTEKYRVLVVPYSPVLSQPAARKIARFARSGGTVLLAGPAGRMDPWLNAYANLGGPAWAELKWKMRDGREDFGQYLFDTKLTLPDAPGASGADTAGTKNEKRDETINENKIFRGLDMGTIHGAEAIRDGKGNVVGWRRPWGRGKLIAYGMYPDTWTTDPHVTPNLAAWMKQVIGLAEMKFTGRWTTTGVVNPVGGLGAGAPAVDLVVREKSPDELFIFALNQGGKGEGVIEIPVTEGTWLAEDVTDPSRKIAGEVRDGVWRCPTTLNTLGYRVLRLWRSKPK